MNVYLGVTLFAATVFTLSWMSTFGASMLFDAIYDHQHGKPGSTGIKRRTENNLAIARHFGK